MDKKQDHRRLTPQQRLNEAYAKKPGMFRYTPKGLIITDKQNSTTTPQAIMRQQKHGKPTVVREPTSQILSEEANAFFITGGIGDFLAVESHLPQIVRDRFQHILLATRAQEGIKELLANHPTYSKCKVSVVYDDWSRFFCFLSKEDAANHVLRTPDFDRSIDLSISKIFPLCRNKFPYIGSGFLQQRLIDIEPFHLPTRYFVICPYSVNDRHYGKRDFNYSDWENCLKFLNSIDCIGVVLNVGNDYVPENGKILNLSNKTTITEAIEITKCARGYIGVDSCLSVIAAKTLKDIYVKSINSHLDRNKSIYYAPRNDLDFIHPDLSQLSTLE